MAVANFLNHLPMTEPDGCVAPVPVPGKEPAAAGGTAAAGGSGAGAIVVSSSARAVRTLDKYRSNAARMTTVTVATTKCPIPTGLSSDSNHTLARSGN